MIHLSSCHIMYNHVQTTALAAINTTNYTERQQFSVVTVSIKSGFLRFKNTRKKTQNLDF